MPDPTPQQILDTPMPGENDAGATTVRGYLVALLSRLWWLEEGFSGKRPFGNSGWAYDVYEPLVKAGLIEGSFDEDGYVEGVDVKEADRLILAAIRALDESAPAAEPTPEQAEAERIIRSAVEDIEMLTIAEMAAADTDPDRIDDLIRSATVTVTWAQDAEQAGDA